MCVRAPAEWLGFLGADESESVERGPRLTAVTTADRPVGSKLRVRAH